MAVGQSYVRPCVSVPTSSDSTGIELYSPQPVRSIRSCHFLLAITDQTPRPCKDDAKSGRLGFLGFSHYLGVRVSPSLSCRCFCFGHIKFVDLSYFYPFFVKKNNREMCTHFEISNNKSKWSRFLFKKIRFDLHKDKNMKCLINSQYEVVYMVEYIN